MNIERNGSKQYNRSACALLLGLASISTTTFAHIQQSVPNSLTKTTNHTKTLAASALSGLQIPFVQNTGQTHAQVGFYAKTFAGTTYVTRNGELVYEFPSQNGKSGWTLIERFTQGKPNATGAEANNSKVSYIQNQAGKAVTENVQTYNKLDLGEVFDGIYVDLVAHGNNVEKVYTVTVGADANDIKMQISGANQLSINANGALVAQTGNGPVEFSTPNAWQERNGQKAPVKVSYVLNKDGYQFSLGEYDHSRKVTIDPLLQATYMGGTGTETALEIAVHPVSGDVYVLGATLSPGRGFTNTLPGTAGGWTSTQTSTETAFLSRLSADLKTLIQTTYLQGLHFDSSYYPHLLLHPGNNDVYIWGLTLYSEIATTPGITGGAITTGTNNGFGQAYLSRFSSDLTQLKQTTLVSTDNNFTPASVAVNKNTGDIYLLGKDTTSLYTTDGYEKVRLQRVPADLKSAITQTRIDSSDAAGHDIAIHPVTGDVFVTGSTEFKDFPNTAGGYQPAQNSLPAIGWKSDGFIAQLSPDLTTIKQATYFGGTQEDWADTIVFNNTGDYFYLAGGTCSADFPGLAGGAYSKPPTNKTASCSEYFAKISSDLKSLAQSTMVQYGAVYMSIFVHPTSGDIYAIGTLNDKKAYPFAEHYKSDLTYFYGGFALNNLKNHPGVAYDMSPLTGDIYVIGNQESETPTFPQTSGGFQATPATTSEHGNNDIYVARYTSDDIQSYVPKADLSLILSSNVDIIETGSQIAYTVTVTNNGPDQANSVIITNQLPNTVTFSSASSECRPQGSTVTCNAGALNNGASKSFTIGVMPTAVGGLTNNASVVATESDATPGNNTAVKIIEVTALPVSPAQLNADVEITQAVSADKVEVGKNVTYTFTVNNKGPDTAKSLEIIDNFPTMGTFERMSENCRDNGGNIVSCSIPALASGASIASTVNIKTTGTGSFSNTASIDGAENDPISSNNSATKTIIVSPYIAPPLFNLKLSLTATANTAKKNKPITYTLTVKNIPINAKAKKNKLVDATNVKLAFNLPNGSSFVSAPKVCQNPDSNGVVNCTIGKLKKQASKTLSIKIRAPNVAQRLKASASVTSDGTQQTDKDFTLTVK